MRVAVISCVGYSDAWDPFDQLFKKFWPNQDYDLVTDSHSPGKPWCKVVAEYAAALNEPVVMFQEDMFLTRSVDADLIQYGINRMKQHTDVGAVRFYPCPGASDWSSDPYFGQVARHTPYRNSLQLTAWQPHYLRAIAERYDTPSEFELLGSSWASRHRPELVFAFKRDVQPWPVEYICSAISRGKWEPTAIAYCAEQGIKVDTSKREMVRA